GRDVAVIRLPGGAGIDSEAREAIDISAGVGLAVGKVLVGDDLAVLLAALAKLVGLIGANQVKRARAAIGAVEFDHVFGAKMSGGTKVDFGAPGHDVVV